jgi:hypothetical protein
MENIQTKRKKIMKTILTINKILKKIKDYNINMPQPKQPTN